MYNILKKSDYTARFSEQGNAISPFDIGIPLLDISDKTIQQIYYFRWHVYCKHIKNTPHGWVITEFLPDVSWAGKYNTISCAAGHHFYEGRWLHDTKYLRDYARFWFSDEGEPRRYSFWAADAILAACKVWGDYSLATALLCDLRRNYNAWVSDKKTKNGLFKQIDDRDGMEYSIGGSGCRPTINSYMYADAKAIAEIAKLAGQNETAEKYRQRASEIKEKINELLWDAKAEFFKTRTEGGGGTTVNVRELIGYVPWYFNIPTKDKTVAWKFLKDTRYFSAPYGPTTAEQNHPDFMKQHNHECLWNGPSWPYATSQTLTAMGNLIANYNQSVISEADYFDLLRTYASSQYLTLENGKKIPFIDEDLDPYSGTWIARDILQSIQPSRKDAYRGKDYNHSTFCDLVLSGLVGVRTDKSDSLTVHPMFTADQLEYLCADGILWHGHSVTVLWDKEGNRYGKGAGLQIMCDGKTVAHSETLSELLYLRKG